MSLPLPAHRYEARKKVDDDAKTWVYDFDETITKAPKHVTRLATALRALGDRIVVLTGNQSPRDELIKSLEMIGFPFDDLIQYHDSESDGIIRAEYLKELDAWAAVDNRIDRAPTYTKVCPHFFVVARPSKDAKKQAKGDKQDVAQAVSDTNKE